jgi:hypothetical protein
MIVGKRIITEQNESKMRSRNQDLHAIFLLVVYEVEKHAIYVAYDVFL